MPRIRPTTQREDLIAAALAVARRDGYATMTREAIASEAGCSTGQVTTVLGTMPQLRRAVMRAAVARRDLQVIAQGIVAKDAHVRAAPLELRQRALQEVL